MADKYVTSDTSVSSERPKRAQRRAGCRMSYSWVRSLRGFVAWSCCGFGAQRVLNYRPPLSRSRPPLPRSRPPLYCSACTQGAGWGGSLRACEALSQLSQWGLALLVHSLTLNDDNNPGGFTVRTGLKLSVFWQEKELKWLMRNDGLRSVSVRVIPETELCLFPSSARAEGHYVAFHLCRAKCRGWWHR